MNDCDRADQVGWKSDAQMASKSQSIFKIKHPEQTSDCKNSEQGKNVTM